MTRPQPPRARSPWTATLLAACVTLLGVAGCSTTVTSTDTAGSTVGRPAQPVATPEPVDPVRRAAVRLELASAYFARGQSATALAEVKQALVSMPDLAPAHALAGLIHASLGDDAQAEQSFRRAVQIDPRDGDTLHNFGWYLCQRRRFPDADAQFAAALALPTYRGVSRTLLAQGVCQARGGALEQAERTLSRSFDLDPANPTTAVNLAEVLYRRGEYERARFYVARVNSQPDLVSAQTLWLAARIERRLGNEVQLRDFGARLRERFPQSPEALRFDRGRFDE